MKRKAKDEYYHKAEIFEGLPIKKLRTDEVNYITIQYHQKINLNEIQNRVLFLKYFRKYKFIDRSNKSCIGNFWSK